MSLKLYVSFVDPSDYDYDEEEHRNSFCFKHAVEEVNSGENLITLIVQKKPICKTCKEVEEEVELARQVFEEEETEEETEANHILEKAENVCKKVRQRKSELKENGYSIKSKRRRLL